MESEILKLAKQLKKLVDKEAGKEKKAPQGTPPLFQEFSKDLQFYITELEVESD